MKKLTADNKVILNKCATNYGLEFGDFIRISILENEEKEQIKKNKILEAEKAQFSVINVFFLIYLEIKETYVVQNIVSIILKRILK